MFEQLRERGYQIEFVSHAQAILQHDFPDAVTELEAVILNQSVPIEELIGSGGGETKGTQRLRNGLTLQRWLKETFTIRKTINNEPKESISHKVDHVRVFDRPSGQRYRIALEIEWNNKDPFFDRDLENFKRLHAEGGISLGIIVTRGASLQDSLRELVRRWVEEKAIDSFENLEAAGVVQTARQRREVLKRVQRVKKPIPFREAWTHHFVSDKFGTATTHWRKLEDRIRRGVGNPCPLVLIGLPPSIVTFGEDPRIVRDLLEAGAKALEEEGEEYQSGATESSARE
jgi:restriction endonuclease BglII